MANLQKYIEYSPRSSASTGEQSTDCSIRINNYIAWYANTHKMLKWQQQ